MGVGISRWPLARAVASSGQLGVVSGTALDVVHARCLADGDPGGHLRRAYATFPDPEVVQRVLHRYYRCPPRGSSDPYPSVPRFTVQPGPALRELTILANYAEVWLARDGHDGPVGINLLEKVQLPTVFALYGAMLAHVDAVLMGAGIPSAIPALLRTLAAGEVARYAIRVEGDANETDGSDGASKPSPVTVDLDPASIDTGTRTLPVPRFLAIVSAHTLATFLARDPATRPDGFVVEGPTAGGHNAPPRRNNELDDRGQPVYGERDRANLSAIAKLGLPFWLAGGYGSPEGVAAARRDGAAGVQVGSIFVCCEESGLEADLKGRLVAEALDGTLEVRTDPLASPTGFPFKVVELDGSLSDQEVYDERERVCDLGFLRVQYRRPDGSIGYRCPGEPEAAYRRKGGNPEDTKGRVCLCNGLLATAGLAQQRPSGPEPPVITGGNELAAAISAINRTEGTHTARDIIDYLLAVSGPDARAPAPDLTDRTVHAAR